MQSSPQSSALIFSFKTTDEVLHKTYFCFKFSLGQVQMVLFFALT